MGTFHEPIEIGNPARKGRKLSIDALVDAGATYTWVPAPLLRRIGVKPTESWPFKLADGRVVSRKVAEVTARVKGRESGTWVVFGDAESEPLLGAYTLEGVRLTVDCVHRELVPVAAYAVGFAHAPRERKRA